MHYHGYVIRALTRARTSGRRTESGWEIRACRLRGQTGTQTVYPRSSLADVPLCYPSELGHIHTRAWCMARKKSCLQDLKANLHKVRIGSETVSQSLSGCEHFLFKSRLNRMEFRFWCQGKKRGCREQGEAKERRWTRECRIPSAYKTMRTIACLQAKWHSACNKY